MHTAVLLIGRLLAEDPNRYRAPPTAPLRIQAAISAGAPAKANPTKMLARWAATMTRSAAATISG